MHRPGGSGLTLRNARTGPGPLTSLRIVGGRIAAIGGPPRAGDLEVDLRGDHVLPGLINAHDHLQLNALPRLGFRPRHRHVSEWIDDIRQRLKSDPLLVANAAVPREQRLLIGGIKNLLSGVTTVAHHDPCYPSLTAAGYPVRVLAGAGWSHSLLLDGADAVRSACEQTPRQRPWIIHAAEGVDATAAAEFDTLESLGCVNANTLIVHGLALSREQQLRLARAGAALIWCPGSNLHLFGRTVDVGLLFEHRRLALGSDSRISGEQDLLAELRVAREASRLDEAGLESIVTDRAAQLLRLDDRGRLAPGCLGDLLVLPAGLPLSRACRADIRLVLIGGVPRYADPELARAFGSGAALAAVSVDGRTRWLASHLVAQLRLAQVSEPGLVTEPALQETCA